ncbi:activating transcription factor 7-interacting protein 1 isoform X2 [Linepithema humile]|uniref:activating transcription factor 7-interacting protein 1 isoform X2 n=1 Tax=Linepithema humile TaxID=83485 RepID=UPI0006234709|nr:PREDICTED: activating transcription factor 7-interacting protein 1 isoform X2 [Linepithema humile]
MEKAQIEAAKSEAISTVSYVNSTNTNELSKEKEDELLFGADEDGDDEDALSDDSLRLRLSDDEDIEQEDNTTNLIKISELKSQNKKNEQLPINIIVENKICLNTQEIVEEITKSDSRESAPTQEKRNSVIKIAESSALPSDECVSKNKRKGNNVYNPENNSTTVSESNKKCIVKFNNDLEIAEINNFSLNATSKHVKLENDNSSTNYPSNIKNEEVTIDDEDGLKEAVNDKPINSTNIFTVVSNSNNNNLSDIINKVIDKAITDDKHHSTQNSLKINDSQNSMDLVKSHNFDNLPSTKDSIDQVKSKNKNEEHKNIKKSKNSLNTQSMQEETITILESDENDLSNIKDKTRITKKTRDINEHINQFVDKVYTSSLQTILLASIDVEESNNESETKNDYPTVPKTKRTKKTSNKVQDEVIEEPKQEAKTESGRYKRKTARNAEEIIRKKYLNSDSDSSDSAEEIVTTNLKLNQNIRLTSPPPLRIIKRNSDNEIFNGNLKKFKTSSKSEEKNDITKLAFVEKFFQRDVKEKLLKLTQEELEELLIQKIVETITMRSEIGQLREQARISEKNQEAMRGKLQQLTKQVKDFEMVLNRNAADRRANADKLVAPIKINRSVGLQVNFITEQGIQSLRQIQQTHVKPTNVPSTISSPAPESNNNNTTSPRRGGIKTRSPRPVVTTPTTPTVSQSPIQTAPLISTVTPAALVVAKPLEASHTLTLPNQPTGVQPILPTPQIQPQSHQTILLNGKIQNQVNRPQSIVPKPRNNDLIDLTDEEEKNKTTNVKVTSVTTASVLEQQMNVTSKPVPSFQRVLQTIPTNVAITTQQASIRVIAPNQPAPTALVNNINSPRLAYVMQSGMGSPRPVLITSNANQQVQIRPVTTCRAPFSTVTYQTGVSSIANGTVRVITTPALSNIQMSKHPAPLPDTPTYGITPGWKLPPPAPSLKIAKVANGKDGIVLSWNMNLSDKYAEIASYQLYAYQEVPGVNPTTTLWKKVGDVRALPLPMACTLTQFSEGNNYYFAVRAVDTHSRKGQYSIPGNISL